MSNNRDQQPQQQQVPGNLTLEIRHLDVIGGDSTLIFVRNNDDQKILYKMLIDSGAERGGGARLVSYLSGLAELKEQVTVGTADTTLPVLDCIVATHYHLDHIEGFTRFNGVVLFRRFVDNAGYRVNDVFVTPRNGLGKGVQGTTTFSQYTAVISANRVNGQPAQRLDVPFIDKDFVLTGARSVRIPLGENTGITLTCYCANGILADGTDVLGAQRRTKNRVPSPNDLSLALLLEWEDFRYFTAGDLSGDPEMQSYYDIEGALVSYLTNPKDGPLNGKTVTVMRVSHHGSEHSNQASLFDKLRPEVVVVSCNTRKKVPSPVFLQRLAAYLSARPDARAVFVNTLYYSDKDDRYARLADIKDNVPAGNILFKEDKGANVVTNTSIKTVHVRRNSGGRVPQNDVENDDFKSFVRGTYEIVLGKRSGSDETAELKMQKLRTYLFKCTFDVAKIRLGSDKFTDSVVYRDFGKQADLLASWIAQDATDGKSEGEDYIRLNYPGLISVVEKNSSADQLSDELLVKMKAMFDGTFELKTASFGDYYAPVAKNTLSPDEKETIFQLLVSNQHQMAFNKAAGFWKPNVSSNKFLNETWNSKGGEFEEPYLPGAVKRKSELAFAEGGEGEVNE